MESVNWEDNARVLTLLPMDTCSKVNTCGSSDVVTGSIEHTCRTSTVVVVHARRGNPVPLDLDTTDQFDPQIREHVRAKRQTDLEQFLQDCLQ